MKSIVFFSLLIMCQLVLSQEIDKRLLPKYSKVELQKMQKENINEYNFLLNALNKGVFIGDIPHEKGSSVVFDGELSIDPNQNHNFISLGLEIKDKYQYFKIKGTDKMLGVLPRFALDEKMLKEKTQSIKK